MKRRHTSWRVRHAVSVMTDGRLGHEAQHHSGHNGSGASSPPAATRVEPTVSSRNDEATVAGALATSGVGAFHVNRDRRFLWLGEPHRAVFEALYGAVLRGCPLVMLTGEVGAGKTMLTDAVAVRLAAGGAVVGRLVYPSRDPDDFWNAMVDAFGLVTDSGGRDAALMRFTDLVQRAARTSRRVLLVIDEAQVVTSEVVAEVGRACDAVRDAGAPNVLTVLLVGEDALELTLARPELAGLAARIGMRRRLAALGESEVASYVTHRLACADAPPDVFTLDALRAIAAISRGIPRLINTLCARAVTSGGVVDATIVERCGREMAWLVDHGKRRASLHATLLGSVLSRTRSSTVRILVTALLVSAGVLALALTKGGEGPATSRRAGAAPVADVTLPVAPVRPAFVTAPATPTPDAESDPQRGRLAASGDGALSSPVNAQQRPTVKTTPRREMDRTAATTGTAKRPALPNIADPSTSSRHSTPRPPDDAPGDPDPGEIINWLLKDRSQATAISH